MYPACIVGTQLHVNSCCYVWLVLDKNSHEEKWRTEETAERNENPTKLNFAIQYFLNSAAFSTAKTVSLLVLNKQNFRFTCNKMY